MARIRTLKPEFWASPSHRHADPWVRLFYVSMWNWADDTGRGTANPRELAAFAFPDDEDPTVPTVDDVPRLLLEVQQRYDVVFYKVAGRRYYWITKFDRHQRNERKADSRYPAPDEGQPYDPGPPDGVSFTESRSFSASSTETPGHCHGSPGETPRQPSDEPGSHAEPETRSDDQSGPSQTGSEQQEPDPDQQDHGSSATGDGDSDPGTGEQGNRGTTDTRTAAAARTRLLKAKFENEFWPAYPLKRDKQDALKMWLKVVRERNLDPDELVTAAARYAADPVRVARPEFTKYASTWLNKGSYADDVRPQQTTLSVVPDLPTSFEEIRSELNTTRAGDLLGRSFWADAQPPSDPTPPDVWERDCAARWLDKNEAGIRAALSRRRVG